MQWNRTFRSILMGGSALIVISTSAGAAEHNFDIPKGNLATALDDFVRQTGVQLVYRADQVNGVATSGAKGPMDTDVALTRILVGTTFVPRRDESGAIAVVREAAPVQPIRVAANTARPAAATTIETVTVTAQKVQEDIQTVPIAVTALSQKQLTERQIAGGPDLIKQVPNLTFSKTNFTGYNLEIRGIGTQAISATTDPAVAVAFNDTPFLRNHFFEQEFYDLGSVEVLRGPQGTLYGRNATAGVVNIKSALPTGTYEAMVSADFGNYNNRRLEAMLNLPIVGDTLDLRLAGEWTKRDGYTINTFTNSAIDGRDLWSTRASLAWNPTSTVQSVLVWEHFSEDDNRLRSGKQLCQTDFGPGSVDGVPKPIAPSQFGTPGDFFTQGCKDVSLYSPNAFQAPLGYALPFVLGLDALNYALPINPYAETVQSTNLRSIESTINPNYRAKNDTLEWNSNWQVTPELNVTAQTAFNNDFLWSSEDFNRFGSTPGIFLSAIAGGPSNVGSDPSGLEICISGGANCGGASFGQVCSSGNDCRPAGYFCDPQLGCSDRLIVQDVSTEKAWQLSQEFRLASNFSGPLNFNVGANYLHFETTDKYYVLSNALTLITGGSGGGTTPTGFRYNYPNEELTIHGYVDPNPLSNLNDQGHNYFLSKNPYVLNSYAVFGEANYKLSDTVKLTGGLRWTDDQKHFTDIPSEVATQGYGLFTSGVVNQKWDRLTGRAVVNWTPKLDFTDQTLVYGSYAHGYKAGGANPPGAQFTAQADVNGQIAFFNPVHPLTFKPEYIEAFELGTKNTMLDGSLTLNADVFYYNYTGYQISEIVDRTAINTNYNAHVTGAELEFQTWEPIPGLKFSFSGGLEDSGLAGGEQAVDLLDRTAGHPDWFVVKPFVTEASNCIFPGYVAKWMETGSPVIGAQVASFCSTAYTFNQDPLTGLTYVQNPTMSVGGEQNIFVPGQYPGFDPTTAPNAGQGFSKNLAGHQLPNAPHFTVSFTSEYTIPVTNNWAATLHADFYWQSSSWARVFEDQIDKIHGYPTVNASVILTSADGWQVMGYVKNIFDVTAITGTFLNSDDTGLTTNIFTTDPRLFGARVTKHLDEGDGFWGADYSGAEFFNGLFADADHGKPSVWVELGGSYNILDDEQQPFAPPFFSTLTKPFTSPIPAEHPPGGSFDYSAKVSYQPDGTDWLLAAAVRYGRASRSVHLHEQTKPAAIYFTFGGSPEIAHPPPNYLDAITGSHESHAIFDFAAGRDFGLGMFGLDGTSDLSAGVRFAQFTQSSQSTIHAEPNYVFKTLGPKYGTSYFGANQSKRSFHGIGPSLAWDASTPVFSESDSSSVTVDWGANGAVLFGRQLVRGSHQTSGTAKCSGFIHSCGANPVYSHYQRTTPVNRARSVTVPNFGAFAGISWRYNNARVSFGYRADEFFGAMDGGIDIHKSYNVGMFGPYARITLGLGG